VPHLIVTRNLETIYDVPTAIRAFAIVAQRHPDAAMTVAGSGPEREALEALVRELGLDGRVHFTGRLDNAELPALYRRASVAVNASRVDNFPISLLEAMASGVPIVSTDVVGVPHLVAHESTALLVPPGAPEAMADAILRVTGDRELALKLRHAGIEAVQSFAWTRVRRRLFDVYAGRSVMPPCDID
jgi:glycosyltransferase involved in cell wall biosynthesis